MTVILGFFLLEFKVFLRRDTGLFIISILNKRVDEA